jgi:hypothetical protein
VHSKDSLGLWGPTLSIPLIVDHTGPGVDAASVGPNPSNGILTNKSNPGYLYISASITDKDAGGSAQSNLVDAEAFLDTATKPAGSGLQLIAVDGRLDSTSEAVYGLIPISQVKALTDGTHHVYVRGQDAAGNWGDLYGISLLVDKKAPVLGALAGAPNPTNGSSTVTLTAPVTEANTLGNAEFWLGTTDPGVGKATVVPVSVVNGSVVAMVPLAGIAAGTVRFNLRVQDAAGNWSNAVNTSVTVTRPNLIFTGLFEGSTPGWSSSVGGTSIRTSTAAKLISVLEPSSTQGLAVTIPSTATGRVSYVVDTTPAAETSYHARFAFNRNTLTSGTSAANVLTLFEGRTNNSQAFTVQFRMSGTTAQLRTTLNRSAGGTLTGTWVNLAAGQHVLQVDWVGATAGSVVLTVDGAAVATLTGNTSTLRVENASLGVTAGVNAGAGGGSGTAWFDSFTSTRYSLQ